MLKDTILGLKEVPTEFIPILTFYPENKRKLLDNSVFKPLEEIYPEFINKFHIIPQHGPDINSRFSNTFKIAFDNLKLDHVLIIGSDTPHLQPKLLNQSIILLEEDTKNAILGPSQDGGFYLLAHSHPFIRNLGSIFHPLSSYGELVNAMELLRSKYIIHILPEVTDVDTFENLKTVRNIIKILSLTKSTYSESIDYYLPRFTEHVLDKQDATLWIE